MQLDAFALIVDELGIEDAHILDLLLGPVRLEIDAGSRRRSARVAEARMGDEHTVGIDDRHALAPVMDRRDRAEFHVLGALHVEAVAPHLLGGDAADGDALGAAEDADAHAAFAAFALCSPRSPSSVPPVTVTFDAPAMSRIE